MKKLEINSDYRYEVLIDVDWKDFLSEIERNHSKVLFIIPETLKDLVSFGGLKNVFITPDAEAQKNLSTVEKIWEKCGEIGLSRDGAIVGIGGGATTDLAGFVAATWLRGIDWYAFPTSLAGAIDAAIGGKTGINSSHGKNLIGAFHSPKQVVVDLSFFKTLPERDFKAGMAEIIKCGFIKDTKILNLLENVSENLVELIYRSIKVKSEVVSRDFKEGKLREILNYGHTLGHAVEKNENYKLRHGEAVSIGLVFAAELSRIKLGLKDEYVQLHRQILAKFDLPVTYKREAFIDLLALMSSDKKVRNSRLRFIGVSKPGRVEWIEEVSEEDLRLAYERISI